MKPNSLIAAQELTKAILETKPEMLIVCSEDIKTTANTLADFIETLAHRIDAADENRKKT